MSFESGITLFTSDSRPKYAEDALNVLALPSGSKYQFRYDIMYVNSELRNVFSSQKNVINTKALIVFRDESSSENNLTYMVPLRWVTIESVELISDFYVLRFVLDGYPSFSKEYVGDKNYIKQLGKKYLEQIPVNLQHFPIQVGITPFVDLRNSSDLNYWIDIVRRLAQHDGFKNTHFLKISQVVNQNSQKMKFISGSGYVLSERRYGTLQIDYFAANFSDVPVSLEVVGDSSLIRVVNQSHINLDNRYDSRKISFQAGSSVVGDTITELMIFTQSELRSAPRVSVSLPFLIRKSRSLLAYKILLNSLGALLVSVPGIVGSSVSVEIRIILAFFGALFLVIGTIFSGAGK